MGEVSLGRGSSLALWASPDICIPGWLPGAERQRRDFMLDQRSFMDTGRQHATCIYQVFWRLKKYCQSFLSKHDIENFLDIQYNRVLYPVTVYFDQILSRFFFRYGLLSTVCPVGLYPFYATRYYKRILTCMNQLRNMKGSGQVKSDKDEGTDLDPTLTPSSRFGSKIYCFYEFVFYIYLQQK